MLRTSAKRAYLRAAELRRKIARLIEPRDPPPDPKWDIPIDFALRGPRELREHLGVTEDMYMFAAGHSMADARGYVVYTALDEVEKVAMYLMRLREFMQGPSLNPREGRPERLILEHLLEEQEARERRLLEVLITLVLFSETNEQEYYRHFLLIESIDEHLSANQDLEEFFGARSANIDYSIGLDRQWIERGEHKIDLGRCWYLRDPKPIATITRLRPGGMFSSVRQRLLKALPLMSDHERMIVGLSYAGGYGRASAAIHFRSSPNRFYHQPGLEERAVFSLSMLVLVILRRCHQLIGEPTGRVADRVRDSLDRTSPSEQLHNIAVRDISVGDFVLAYGDLAEVLEIRATAYGYRSYRVRYLAERPIPEIKEDWFPARYVQLFYTREHFHAALEEQISSGNLPASLRDGFDNMPPDQVQEILRRSLLSTWQMGLKDWVQSQRRQ